MYMELIFMYIEVFFGDVIWKHSSVSKN